MFLILAMQNSKTQYLLKVSDCLTLVSHTDGPMCRNMLCIILKNDVNPCAPLQGDSL